MSNKKRVVLQTLSEFMSEGRGILVGQGVGTLFRGDGPIDYLCGKCGQVLMENMRGLPPISNGCIQCSSCKANNDISSLGKYLTPAWKNDILSGSKAWVEKFEGYMPGTIIHPKVIQKSDNLMQDFVSAQGIRPEIIYHYTKSDGLIGILKYNSFWATSTSYLNDKNEIYHARRIIREEINKHKAGSSELFLEIIRRVEGAYEDTMISNEYYIVCFCENGDLLSQWRAYGDNGLGYSIGIQSRIIGQSPKSKHIKLRRVIYDESWQRDHVSSIISNLATTIDMCYGVASIAELDRTTVLPTLCSILHSHLVECTFTFKDSSFSEEKEWRVVINAKDNDIDFRTSGSRLTPYLVTDLGTTEKNYPLLPISEIISGPLLDPVITRNSIKMIMEKFQYYSASYRSSVSPYRI